MARENIRLIVSQMGLDPLTFLKMRGTQTSQVGGQEFQAIHKSPAK
jgi:hypothetical protein